MKPGDISFAFGLPHTPWVPARVESFARLKDQLKFPRDGDVHLLSPDERVFSERASNNVWSLVMWTWAAEMNRTHFLTLQDDAIVAPDFWRALRALVAAHPDEIIGFEVVHPLTRALAEEGHRWFTTSDMLIGVGYVVPLPVLRDFLAWRKAALRPGATEALDAGGKPVLTEDTLLALFCLATGRRLWHPIPTIIDHDTSLESTYGNDAHGARRPPVRWDEGAGEADLSDPEFWSAEPPFGTVPHVGRFYEATPALAYAYVLDATPADYTRWRSDTGNEAKRRIALRHRARIAENPSRARVFLATPLRGEPHPEYNTSVWTLILRAELDIENAWELLHAYQWDYDLVRVRSRYVRAFLETQATHLFFVDGDISFRPEVLLGMLETGLDIVAAPYPKRNTINWTAAVEPNDPRPLGEARAYAYPMNLLEGRARIDPKTQTVEVAGMPLGCCLIRREALERMVAECAQAPRPLLHELARETLEHLKERPRAEKLRDLVTIFERVYEEGRNAEDLTFLDEQDGKTAPTVALFQLALTKRQELLSEDLSFCARARAIGLKVHAYFGPGSPVTHHGTHTYRGSIEAFGLRRLEA